MKCDYLKKLKLDKKLQCSIYNNKHTIACFLYPMINDKRNIDSHNKLLNSLNKIFINSNYSVEIINDRSYEGAHNYKAFVNDNDSLHEFVFYFFNGIDEIISLKKQFTTSLPLLTEKFNKAYIEYIENAEEFNVLSEEYLEEMHNILKIKNKQRVFK